MKKQYSLGVFLDLLNNNISEWEHKIAFIDSLSNVEHVEIWVEILPLTSDQIVFLNRNLKRYRRLIHAPFVGVDFLSPNLPIRQAAFKIFSQTKKLAKRLGAQHITWHLGRIPQFMDPKTAVSLLSTEVEKQLRTSYPFTQSLENLPQVTGAAVAAFPMTLLDNYLPNFRNIPLTLDVGHCIRSGEDPIKMFVKYRKRIRNIHLVDVTKDGADHQQLGTGIFKLDRFMKTLDKYWYDRFVSVEVIGEPAIRSSWKLLQNFRRRHSKIKEKYER